ncbi:MAG: aspartate--ammonia ligase [Negativicutes bacterium]|nr:aspartate--ammonia ligase [Negativicutes bacterium]
MTALQNCIPTHYHSKLSLLETQISIKKIKDYFEAQLAANLSLIRVSAPLMVRPSSGLNDDLNGCERPVSFDLKNRLDQVEIVQSLAKWKRYALHQYGFDPYTGLYTDMNAIRRDEQTDNIHSVYVDQWDWETIIAKADRTLPTLETAVRRIYDAFLATETYLEQLYPFIRNPLPGELTFLTTEELFQRYPNRTAKERELAAVREFGAVFLEQIGCRLSDGSRHDQRAADYDDWNLNGDLLFYFRTLDIAIEMSSMGIRVDAAALLAQLSALGQQAKLQLPFHRDVLSEKLPFTMGGGIGQSRMCMFFLQKAHIGEVQASVWPAETLTFCRQAGVNLL